MAYSKVPSGHSEFGGGPGLIDPEARRDRNLTGEESLLEIYATRPHAREGSASYDPATANLEDRSKVDPWPDASTAIGTTS